MIDFEFSYDQFDSSRYCHATHFQSASLELRLVTLSIRIEGIIYGYFVNDKNKLFQCMHILLSSSHVSFVLLSFSHSSKFKLNSY